MNSNIGNTSRFQCSICQKFSDSTNDTVIYGEWMRKSNLRVHYFCLLLSTHLQQNGPDTRGILGFEMRDIRRLIKDSERKLCDYCEEPHATIECANCHLCFHLMCASKNQCRFEFIGEFRSYCRKCTRLDVFQKQTLAKAPTGIACWICRVGIGKYNPYNMIHSNCCQQGFVHRSCMQEYALSAGYYLVCIWCRSNKFRDHVRRMGIFVPDRDACWERQRNAYRDLHCGHKRCDWDPCACPKGNVYKNNTTWDLLICKLCGSFGAHRKCLPATAATEFKCPTCVVVERSLENASSLKTTQQNSDEDINMAFYMTKINTSLEQLLSPFTAQVPSFSEDESISSVITVVPSQHNHINNSGFQYESTTSFQTPPLQQQPVTIDLCTYTEDAAMEQTNIDNFAKNRVVIQGAPMRQTYVPMEQAIIEKTPTDQIVIQDAPQDVPKGHAVGQSTPIEEAYIEDVCIEQESVEEALKKESLPKEITCTMKKAPLRQITVEKALKERKPIPVNGNESKLDDNIYYLSLPLQLHRSYMCEGDPHFYLEVYEISERHNCDCLGMITMRFLKTDPRILNKSQDDLENLTELIEAHDIYSRSRNRGFYEQLDTVIRTIKEKNKQPDK